MSLFKHCKSCLLSTKEIKVRKDAGCVKQHVTKLLSLCSYASWGLGEAAMWKKGARISSNTTLTVVSKHLYLVTCSFLC